MGKLRRKYILLTGSDGGYGNIGDEWLSESVKSRYSKIKKHYNVVILMAIVPTKAGDGFEYVGDDIDSYRKRNISVCDIKAVHYYGGGYLNSLWIKEKLWLYDYLMKSGLSPKKVIFTGAGIGPLSKAGIDKIRLISERSPIFGTRDRNFEKSVGGVFMFDETVAVIKNSDMQYGKKDEIWVNFRIASHAGFNDHSMETLLKDVVLFAIEHKLRLRFFAMINGEGFDERSEMQRILRENGIKAVVHKKPSDYKELLSMLGGAALVVTTSYHAVMASIFARTPVIAIYNNQYYKYKFCGLSSSIDTPLLCVKELSEYSDGCLAPMVGVTDKNVWRKIRKLKSRSNRVYRKYRHSLRLYL